MSPVDLLAMIDTASVLAPVLSFSLHHRPAFPARAFARHKKVRWAACGGASRAQQKGPHGAGLAGGALGDQRCFSESRISRSSTVSSGVAAGAASSGLRSLLMNFTIRKMMNARMTKLIATVMNEP